MNRSTYRKAEKNRNINYVVVRPFAFKLKNGVNFSPRSM